MQEKCTWDIRDHDLIRHNFDYRCRARLSDILRRVRLGWIARGRRSHWIDEEVFKELIVYWNSD